MTACIFTRMLGVEIDGKLASRLSTTSHVAFYENCIFLIINFVETKMRPLAFKGIPLGTLPRLERLTDIVLPLDINKPMRDSMHSHLKLITDNITGRFHAKMILRSLLRKCCVWLIQQGVEADELFGEIDEMYNAVFSPDSIYAGDIYVSKDATHIVRSFGPTGEPQVYSSSVMLTSELVSGEIEGTKVLLEGYDFITYWKENGFTRMFNFID